MSSIGIWRSSSWSSRGTTAMIAARPRPMPFCRSATGGDLLGQLEVGIGPGAVRVVVDHRDAEAGRLADAHVAGDDGVEDQLGEMLADLTLDVLGQARAPVVHREQHPGHGQARVELALD